MTIERILGAVAFLFGLALFFLVIPANVRSAPGSLSDPRLFPNIAAMMFVGLGMLQLLFSRERVELPPMREPLRVTILALVTIVAVFLMEWVGFVIVAPLLMAVLMLFLRERRPVWVAIVVFLLPAAIWFSFHVVLRTPLPS